MSNRRSGTYGYYYGSYWGESAPLTTEQMKTSAHYVFSALSDAGWTPEAISGLLGNLQHESSINPGRWQGDDVGNVSMGYSLVQWTPSTNYTDWCAAEGRSDPSTMDNAIARILHELDNDLQWISTSLYPQSFSEFTQSTGSPYDLACAFAWNYERSAVVLWGTETEKEQLRQLRGGAAESWYTYLTDKEPTPPGSGGSTTTTIRKKKFNFVLFGRKAWRNPT